MLSPVKSATLESVPAGGAPAEMAAHDRGWRRPSGTPSLAEVFGSIRTRPTGSLWRKLLSFLGPGYLVAVGYMDPGNWATSLAGGSKFGYALLTIALLSNLMAILLQALCIRLGIASKRDLAQACRDAFPRFVSYPLWLLAELAICATDLAEVIGTAIGLNLLFGIPLEIGVLLTAADVFLILWMQQLGFRYVEALVVTLFVVIAVCFGIQIAMADPDWSQVIRGFAPTVEIVKNPEIRTRPAGALWRKLLAFLGPGYLVAVGYMDPGNWATSLAGGSKFGYALLTIALLSNLMAILLQALCIRLGIASKRDLAQACRDAFPRFVSYPLWLLAELAICATDLAEVIGTAIGLNLLFGIPLEIGVLLTAADVFLILWMQQLGFRYVEALVVTLFVVIAVCFGIQIAMADPDWGQVIRGFAPTVEIVKNPEMLYLALGILGATVMPHNLYLHSGIVQTRRFGESVPEKREAIKLATIDSTIALMFALLINASILILAASTFHRTGQTDVAELGEVYKFLAPLLGSAAAPSLFALALLACGLNSTVTATLSGQIVMEGFLDIRLPPYLRRLLTRAIAIVPAAIVTIWYGAEGTAKLLILSQVVLSLQLPFAIVPLVMFTADKRKMGALVAPIWVTAIAVLIAITVIILNLKLLFDFFTAL